MADQYLGEIRIFTFSFAPKGWAFCNGQTMSIAQNSALFSLLGTTFGGNGTVNFNLPNLQGRAPVNPFSETVLGESAGEASHTLIASEIPAHSHNILASNGAVSGGSPAGTYLSNQASNAGFSPTTAADGTMGSALAGAGAQSHNNMQPYTVLNFCIATTGIFPSRA
jgi:microcystin-dependent protein